MPARAAALALDVSATLASVCVGIRVLLRFQFVRAADAAESRLFMSGAAILTLGAMESFPSLDATGDADADTDRALAATRRNVRASRGRPILAAPTRADVTTAVRAAAPATIPAAVMSLVSAGVAMPASCLSC